MVVAQFRNVVLLIFPKDLLTSVGVLYHLHRDNN